MEKKLEVKDLRVSFRTQGGTVKAVRNISFDLHKGETLAIVGESGSGKSVTSKAIIGILAGNSIVESGQILYDGMDLLKIDEEDFHRIRGDRIAMVFQDPLSSLNPIVRIGKQLTEAMLLKNRANKSRNRKLFYGTLGLISKNLVEYYVQQGQDKVQHIKELVSTFEKFSLKGIEIENKYNLAHQALIEANGSIDECLLYIRKKQKSNYKQRVKLILKDIERCFNVFTLIKEECELPAYMAELEAKLPQCTKVNVAEGVQEILEKMQVVIAQGIERPAPDFFTLGYYMLKNPEFDLRSIKINELNELTKEFIDKDFMLAFIDEIVLAIENSYNRSIENKKLAIVELQNAIDFFSKESFAKSEGYKVSKKVCKAVKDSIDYLDVRKDTMAYIFGANMNNALSTYWRGVDVNPREESKYSRQKAKWDRLVNRGVTPDWKVAAPRLIDLDLAKYNIIETCKSIMVKYQKDVEEARVHSFTDQAIYTIDFLKEKASGVLYTVTPRMAKEIAIKLMEEVGIPEPRRRYRQYPFEFSGGMRQRIVIAIALAANPDILICDEPTTALDVTIQAQILELINKIKKERNLSIIFITHDLGVVANMADRIGVMYAGKIVEYGTAEEVFYDPRHPYTWALLSSMPDLDTKDKLEAIPGTPPNMIYPPKGDAFAARNKYALNIDFEEEPPMFEVSPTHSAATWLLHEKAPDIKPPKVVLDRIARMKTKGGNINE